MNIDLELYRTFYVVANTGNITKAANILHISQPAVTQAIKKLEESLKGPLFVRTKKGVTLTAEGQEFYKYIKQAMDFIDNAENKFTELMNLETGSIRIGVGTTLTKEFLLPYLELFHSKYPNIKISILTFISAELMLMLNNGLVDMIILHLPTKVLDNIKIIKCHDIHDIFVCNKNYEYLTKEKLSLKDLNNYPLILQTAPSSTRSFFDNFASDNGFVFKPNIELASYNLVVEFIKTGLGIGNATKEYITKELKDKTLFELDVTPSIPVRSIGIAIKENGVPNFATQELISIITKEKNL